MSWIEVLVEGSSDVPAMREILNRRFGLTEHVHFQIHPHKGRGNFPHKVLKNPELQNRSLLYQLPAKLRGFSTWFTSSHWVLVVVDADDTPPSELLDGLDVVLKQLPSCPALLFRIAIEETESWFIADTKAIKAAYPKSNITSLKSIEPDAICGAWERLAEAIHTKGKEKTRWAEAIAPHLNLDKPSSPSLKALIDAIEHKLKG